MMRDAAAGRAARRGLRWALTAAMLASAGSAGAQESGSKESFREWLRKDRESFRQWIRNDREAAETPSPEHGPAAKRPARTRSLFVSPPPDWALAGAFYEYTPRLRASRSSTVELCCRYIANGPETASAASRSSETNSGGSTGAVGQILRKRGG